MGGAYLRQQRGVIVPALLLPLAVQGDRNQRVSFDTQPLVYVSQQRAKRLRQPRVPFVFEGVNAGTQRLPVGAGNTQAR